MHGLWTGAELPKGFTDLKSDLPNYFETHRVEILCKFAPYQKNANYNEWLLLAARIAIERTVVFGADLVPDQMREVETAVQKAGKTATPQRVRQYLTSGFNNKNFYEMLRELETAGKYAGFSKKRRRP